MEFATILWFDDLAAIRALVGDDYAVSHVPTAARAVSFGARAAHCALIAVAMTAAAL